MEDTMAREIKVRVVWRGKTLELTEKAGCTVGELGVKLKELTNVKPETMRLLVPQSKQSGSVSLVPFSDNHGNVRLAETGITEGRTVRMMGVFSAEVEEVSHSTKSDQRIVGFSEEERKAKQLRANAHGVPRKLPPGPYIFSSFRTLQLPGIELNPPAAKALAIMHTLASDPGIVAIMNKHHWHVGIMTEMAPEGYVGISPKCILGFNKNHGEEISLRLRTDDLKGFRKYESIKKTLLHELAHMVHSEHDANFHALDKQLNEEAIALDWTKSRSRTLNGSRKTYDTDEFDSFDETYNIHKLGGNPLHVFVEARGSAVAAALSRVRNSNVIGVDVAYSEPDPDDRESNDCIMQNLDADQKMWEEPDPDSSQDCVNIVQSETIVEPDPDDCLDDHAMVGSDLNDCLEIDVREEPDLDDCLEVDAMTEHDPANYWKSEIMAKPDPDDHVIGETMAEPDPDQLKSEIMVEPEPDDHMKSETKAEPDPDDHIKSETMAEPDPDDHLKSEIMAEPDPDDHMESETMAEPDPDDHLKNEIMAEPDPDDDHMKSETMAGPNPDDHGQSETIAEPDPDDCQQSKTMAEPDPDDCQESKTLAEPDPDDSQKSETMAEPDPNDCQKSKTRTEPDPDDSVKNNLHESSPIEMRHENIDSSPTITVGIDSADLRLIEESTSATCVRLQEAIQRLKNQVSPLEFSSVIRTLFTILRNIMEHPNEAKFKRLRKANPTFQRSILKYEAALEVLLAVGFSEDKISNELGAMEAWLVLKRNDPGLLWLARSSLEICSA
ncbi:uncharacterized protein LOC131072911 isoform X2 [Cryptomeria japonica]|uniref:uncharacterized protein LOC131072911 isoform X2 n=1 Tax=Cryptomeria japonica TaxID=3369 RepID=UPI0027DA9A5B|nr:uncharacterized protein LOC131072911 isoform X2 [Cryptomeria japonica]